MIKSLLIEHCVLPLASLHVRQRVKPEMTARSLLIYGPRGTGKSMLARAIATEAGAMFFDISPHVIEGQYTQGKAGPDMLVYKVLCVAQDLSPSVIYVDNVEQVFIAGKKKKGGAAPDTAARIKKVFVAAIKQVKRGADSNREDRVLFIGVTHQPTFEGVNMKELYETFDFRVWCSFPDCGSRVLLIRKFIEEKDVIVDPAKLNISSLSIAADGYSAGSLKQTVERVLTNRRIQQLKNRPLQVQEFLGPLSRTHFSWPEDWLAFREFDHEASGEKMRIEDMQNKLQKLEGADDPKKKK
jgi:AAA+ superfamily predicted ATPase